MGENRSCFVVFGSMCLRPWSSVLWLGTTNDIIQAMIMIEFDRFLSQSSFVIWELSFQKVAKPWNMKAFEKHRSWMPKSYSRSLSAGLSTGFVLGTVYQYSHGNDRWWSKIQSLKRLAPLWWECVLLDLGFAVVYESHISINRKLKSKPSKR